MKLLDLFELILIAVTPTLFLLSLGSCQPESRNAVPADDTYIYSGAFKAIQQPYIYIGGERYDNDLNESPIQITAEVKADNLVFTIYSYDVGIYEVNFFIEHADCFEFNGSEIVDYGKDLHGNDLIQVIFNEDFWKKCYMADDEEKLVSFILKSEKPIF